MGTAFNVQFYTKCAVQSICAILDKIRAVFLKVEMQFKHYGFQTDNWFSD